MLCGLVSSWAAPASMLKGAEPFFWPTKLNFSGFWRNCEGSAGQMKLFIGPHVAVCSPLRRVNIAALLSETSHFLRRRRNYFNVLRKRVKRPFAPRSRFLWRTALLLFIPTNKVDANNRTIYFYNIKSLTMSRFRIRIKVRIKVKVRMKVGISWNCTW